MDKTQNNINSLQEIEKVRWVLFNAILDKTPVGKHRSVLVDLVNETLDTATKQLQSLLTTHEQQAVERFAKFCSDNPFIIERGNGTLQTTEGIKVDTITLTNLDLTKKVEQFFKFLEENK